MTFITHAFRELEGKGLIEARERTAWNVVAKPRRAPTIDTRPPNTPALVVTTGLIHVYLRIVLDPALIPLGRNRQVRIPRRVVWEGRQAHSCRLDPIGFSPPVYGSPGCSDPQGQLGQ